MNCVGIVGAFFGHKYEPVYDEEETLPENMPSNSFEVWGKVA